MEEALGIKQAIDTVTTLGTKEMYTPNVTLFLLELLTLVPPTLQVGFRTDGTIVHARAGYSLLLIPIPFKEFINVLLREYYQEVSGLPTRDIQRHQPEELLQGVLHVYSQGKTFYFKTAHRLFYKLLLALKGLIDYGYLDEKKFTKITNLLHGQTTT